MLKFCANDEAVHGRGFGKLGKGEARFLLLAAFE
jgi:hypothetical protein